MILESLDWPRDINISDRLEKQGPINAKLKNNPFFDG